ncbi:nucleic acid-binding protein [Trametes cingulata]|nr:nucleic acid-binding protein [Trametes cingulata]
MSVPASFAPNLFAPAVPSEDEPDEIRAIWGTTVNLGETMKTFREFLRGFKIKYRIAYDRERGVRTRVLSSPEEGELLLYEGYLRRMRQTGETNLNLDMINLAAYPPSKKLHSQLVKYPQEVIPAMDQVLKDLMLEIAEEDQQAGMEGMRGEEGEEEISEIMGKVYKIRPFGIPSVNMRDLNPSDTDKLVCIKGLVIRATPVIPDMKVAFFRCLTCNHTVQVEIDRGKTDEPARCPRDVCGSVGTMSLVHNRCEFADRQVIRLQETPDAVPDGQTPGRRRQYSRGRRRDRYGRGEREQHGETEADDAARGAGGALARAEPAPGRVRAAGAIARAVDLRARRHEEGDSAAAVCNLGGTKKSIARGGGGGGPRYRGDINVLLVGDLGVAKSHA